MVKAGAELEAIISSIEEYGIPEKQERAVPPKAFIAHGGKTAARGKLEDFLTALGVTPIIVEEQPSQGRSKDKNVEHYLKQCDCAIILATKGDVDGRTGEFIPRGNILIEIGRCQEILPDRMIYLLEEGAKFPTDIDEKVWERFTKESIDKAFVKIAKELRAFGLLKAMKG
jgi:predicted nucleotide-binding protein